MMPDQSLKASKMRWFPRWKDKNAAFEFCEAEYFLAYKDGKVVGRIAGIINHRANERWERDSVRFGWIDFIDDMEVSKALLDAVAQWGRSKGMTEMYHYTENGCMWYPPCCQVQGISSEDHGQ